MFKKFLIFNIVLFLVACGTLGSKRDKKSEAYIIEPNTRIEKFPSTFNLKGEGIVKTNCPSNQCTSEQADAIKLNEAKSFSKEGEWQEFKEVEDEEKKKKYSVLVSKAIFANNKKNGLYQDFLEKTNMTTKEKKIVKNWEGEYKDDVKQGLWTQFFESGQKLREVTFKDGKKNGLEKKFSEKGTQVEEISFVDDIRQGAYWKKSSQSVNICSGSFDKDKKVGKWIENNPAAEDPSFLKFEFNFADDKKDGAGIIYHDNGKKAAEGNYKQDYKVAFWKEYYPTGQVDSEGNKKAHPEENGKDVKELDSLCPSPNLNGRSKNIGEWKKYYRSGDLFSIGSYDDRGLPSKEWKFYYKGNKLRAKGIMGNSIMMQNGELYDEQNNLEGKGNMMLSMFTIDEKTDAINSKAIPALPFTFYKKGKKYLEILPATSKSADEKVEGEERKQTIAIEYDEAGIKLGEGPYMFIPTQVFGGKKHGCWAESGKKVSYMMGRVQTGMMATMSDCK